MAKRNNDAMPTLIAIRVTGGISVSAILINRYDDPQSRASTTSKPISRGSDILDGVIRISGQGQFRTDNRLLVVNASINIEL